MAVFDVDGPVGRTMQKMAAAPWFAKVGPKVVPPMDKALHKLTGGRVLVSRMLVPSLVLTTTGRKSGLPRESPLACMPEGDGWYVVGSNFGRKTHPAWTGNLLARLLTDDEKADVWPRLTRTWPAFDSYVERSGRNIRVFHLTPA